MSFYFDLSDTSSQLQDILVPAIGDRTKIINESAIHAIYYPTVPNQIFYTDAISPELRELTSSYTKIHLTTSVAGLFVISSRYMSAIERMQELLYDFTYCAENISLSTIPIYYLEPNQRIALVDETLGLNNEYIISKITLPLDYNGLMTIQATKATENIIPVKDLVPETDVIIVPDKGKIIKVPSEGYDYFPDVIIKEIPTQVEDLSSGGQQLTIL